MHKIFITSTALAMLAIPVVAAPSPKHPKIFQSTFCIAQWVDIPGPRVWFTGEIKNTGSEGAMGPMFKVGNRLTWWGDDSWKDRAAAVNQLQKSCPEVEIAG